MLATGMPAGVDPVGLHAPREATLSGYVMTTGEALKVDDLARLPASLRLFGKLPFGTALMAPVGEPGFATLAVARSTGREAFSRAQLRELEVVADVVALALELMDEVPDASVVRSRRTDIALPSDLTQGWAGESLAGSAPTRSGGPTA